MKKIILIGGASIDYIATADEKLIKGVSNDGKLSISFGGVTRNVVENLTNLGNNVTFLTAINDDTSGKILKNHLKNDLKVKFYCPTCKLPSCTYVAINNIDHDLELSIFDNRIINEIDEKFILKHDDLIKKHDFIFLDSNLSKKTINFIVNKYYKTHKIFCDTISPQLGKKFLDVLDKLYLIKCNMFEARALIGDKPLSNKELIKALFKKGIKNIVVSNNKHDIYYGLNNEDIYCFKIKPHVKFKNTTGCGDALMSGIIDQLSLGKDFKTAISFGHKLSSLTLMTDAACSKEIRKYAHIDNKNIFNKDTIKSFKEAKALSRNSNVKSYDNLKDLNDELNK